MHRSNVWVRCASGNVLNSLTNTDSIGLISLDFIAKCVFSNLRVFRFKFYPEVTLDNFSIPVGGRSAARRAVVLTPGRILAQKSVFCYRTPDFVDGPFLALGDSFDLAPSDPFLNFSFPSYVNFREGDPPTQQKVLPHLTVGALTDSNSPSALSARAG